MNASHNLLPKYNGSNYSIVSLVHANKDFASFNEMKKNFFLNEESLVAALRRKERTSYEALYDSYASVLLSIINKIIPDTAIAEDLLSEVFVKIIQSFDQYTQSKGRLFTWMINITRHHCVDKLRSKEFRNSKKNLTLDAAKAHLEHLTTSINPAHTDIRRITQKLEPKEKLLIDLAFFKGYTHKEIAKELDLPLGTIKTRIRKAISQLRIMFDV